MTQTTKKAQMCCARRIASLRRAEADLRNIARRAARRPELHERWSQLVPQAREAIASAERNIADHQKMEHAA